MGINISKDRTPFDLTGCKNLIVVDTGFFLKNMDNIIEFAKECEQK